MNVKSNGTVSPKVHRVSNLTVILVALGVGVLFFLLMVFAVPAIGDFLMDTGSSSNQIQTKQQIQEQAFQDVLNSLPKPEQQRPKGTE